MPFDGYIKAYYMTHDTRITTKKIRILTLISYSVELLDMLFYSIFAHILISFYFCALMFFNIHTFGASPLVQSELCFVTLVRATQSRVNLNSDLTSKLMLNIMYEINNLFITRLTS